jgi:hypothetical protein
MSTDLRFNDALIHVLLSDISHGLLLSYTHM